MNPHIAYSNLLAWGSAITTWAATNQPILAFVATAVAILASVGAVVVSRKTSRIKDIEEENAQLQREILKAQIASLAHEGRNQTASGEGQVGPLQKP